MASLAWERQTKTPVGRQRVSTKQSDGKSAVPSDTWRFIMRLRKGMNDALFFSANSCQKGKSFDNASGDHAADINYKRSSQLPYMMVMNRLAHYLKVLQRENVGAWKSQQVLEEELNKWINQYVTEMDNPDPSTRSRRPLRMAEVKVDDMPDNPSWYRITIRARPHFKFMGANFTLSLTGKLDRE